MQDLQTKLEKLRVEAEDCELIAKLATDIKKRALFAKLAVDLKALARDIRGVIDARASEMPVRKTATRREAAPMSDQPLAKRKPGHVRRRGRAKGR